MRRGEVEDLEVGGRPTPWRSAAGDGGLTDSATSRMSTRTNTPITSAPWADQRGREALDRRAARHGVVDEQHPPARHVGPADRRLVDLMAAVPGLADEGERQPRRQRDRRGQRHAGGLRADDDVGAELAGEARARAPRSRSSCGSAYALSIESGWIGVRASSQRAAPGRTSPGAVASRAAARRRPVASRARAAGWRWSCLGSWRCRFGQGAPRASPPAPWSRPSESLVARPGTRARLPAPACLDWVGAP